MYVDNESLISEAVSRVVLAGIGQKKVEYVTVNTDQGTANAIILEKLPLEPSAVELTHINAVPPVHKIYGSGNDFTVVGQTLHATLITAAQVYKIVYTYGLQ